MEEVIKKKFSQLEQVNYGEYIKRKMEFYDISFPPKAESLGNHKDIVEAMEYGLEWKKPEEIYKDNNFEVFEGINMEDVLQGEIGDCYFLSAMSGTAEFPHRIERIFLTKSYNVANCYAVQLFICGVPLTIVVDDSFPYLIEDRNWAFTHSKGREIWIMVLEKAWAKIHGSYSSVIGGDSRESLSSLTGAPTYSFLHSDVDPKVLWDILLQADIKNYVMTVCGTKRIKGVEASHAYSLIKVMELEREDKSKLKLVQIRNPWGGYEWTGDWSDKSPLWTPELKAKVHFVCKDDGFFYMNFEDYYANFSYTYVCKCKDHYSRTNVVVYEAEALVAFRLKELVRGYFIANQLTSRMGRSCIPDYTIGGLYQELYKLENESFIRVNEPQLTDAVGMACIEAELEPGIYIMRGYFKEGMPKIKFINFTVYCDKHVNLSYLPNVKSVSEVSMKALQSALDATEAKENTKIGIDIFKTAVRLVTSVKHCPKEHKLIFEQGGVIKFKCNTCHKESSTDKGKHTCKACEYNVCVYCSPAPAPGLFLSPESAIAPIVQKLEKKEIEEKKEENKTETMCDKGHKMVISTTPYPYGSLYRCYYCKRSYNCCEGRYFCEECSFDLCRNCAAGDSNSINKSHAAPAKGISKVCLPGVKHYFVKVMEPQDIFACSNCNKEFPVSVGRHICRKCAKVVCSECFKITLPPKPEKSGGQPSSPSKKIGGGKKACCGGPNCCLF